MFSWGQSDLQLGCHPSLTLVIASAKLWIEEGLTGYVAGHLPVNLSSCGIVHSFIGRMHLLTLRYLPTGDVCGFVNRGMGSSFLKQRLSPDCSISSGSFSRLLFSGYHLLLLADFGSAQRVFRVRCCAFCTGAKQTVRA